MNVTTANWRNQLREGLKHKNIRSSAKDAEQLKANQEFQRQLMLQLESRLSNVAMDYVEESEFEEQYASSSYERNNEEQCHQLQPVIVFMHGCNCVEVEEELHTVTKSQPHVSIDVPEFTSNIFVQSIGRSLGLNPFITKAKTDMACIKIMDVSQGNQCICEDAIEPPQSPPPVVTAVEVHEDQDSSTQMQIDHQRPAATIHLVVSQHGYNERTPLIHNSENLRFSYKEYMCGMLLCIIILSLIITLLLLEKFRDYENSSSTHKLQWNSSFITANESNELLNWRPFVKLKE